MKAKKSVALVLIFATLAHAAPAFERRRDVEAALLAHERARVPGDALIGAGIVSLTVAAFCAAFGMVAAMENVTGALVGAALSPLTGRGVSPGRTGEVESLFGVAFATGIGGFVSLLTGIIVRQSMAPASQKRSLLLEQARIEGELRVERRLSLFSEPVVTSDAPVDEVKIDPPPPAPPRRVPLRPRAP